MIHALPCIVCGGPEEDTGHVHIMCERDEADAQLLCAKVEQFTADLPLQHRGMEFMFWNEHGCKWTESLMAGVVPGGLKRLFAAVRVAPSPGPAKANLFLGGMMQIGEDGYARSNHRLNKIMHLPPADRRKAVYAFLRGDTPFCLPAGRVKQLPPCNPFDGLPGGLQAAFQLPPLHALLVSRWYITHNKAMSTFPQRMAAEAQAFSKWIESWVAQDFATFRARSREVSAQSWATIRGTLVPHGHDQPWLKVFVSHPPVGSIMGWPSDVLPVFQQPLCSLPFLAVATVLGMGELWLHDRHMLRVVPVAERQRCMAVLVGSKHLARIQGDNAPGRITAVLLSLPDGDGNA